MPTKFYLIWPYPIMSAIGLPLTATQNLSALFVLK